MTEPIRKSRYDLTDSPLYRLGRIRDLAALLGWRGTPSGLKAFSRRLDHYDIFKRIDPKSGKTRRIEAPKDSLKRLQRRVNALLQRIHVPEYLHSGIPGGSYLTHAAAHFESDGATLTADISKYYPSVATERLYLLFRNDFRCSTDVAWTLARLLSCEGHLATGSPASALVAFMAHRKAFDEIADHAIKRGATFSLYMDDLAFTGQGINRSDAALAASVLARFGLKVKSEKTRLFRASEPKLVTGVAWRRGVRRAPNSQHRLMGLALKDLQRSPRDPALHKSAIGRLQHVALLAPGQEQSLRQMARSLRKRLRSLQDEL